MAINFMMQLVLLASPLILGKGTCRIGWSADMSSKYWIFIGIAMECRK